MATPILRLYLDHFVGGLRDEAGDYPPLFGILLVHLLRHLVAVQERIATDDIMDAVCVYILFCFY
jgi:hypothetical protein